MPPDAFPPDEARGASPREAGDANVVDPVVLAERRALRAEQAERVAAKRAADAQALAAELARERARLEAELERVQVRLAPAADAAEVAEVRRSLASAEEAAASLRRRVEEADEAAAVLRGRVEDAERAAQEAIVARERVEEESEAAAAARSRASAELEAAQSELEGLRAARDAARAEVVTAWKNTEAAHAEIDRAMRERDAARAEAAAAREGADAVVTEAAHVLSQRDAIEAEVVAVRSERDALRDELAAVAAAREAAGDAAAPGLSVSSAPAGPAASWGDRIAAELSLAREARPIADRSAVGAPGFAPVQTALSRALAQERRLVARRAGEPLRFGSASETQTSGAPAAPVDHAAPVEPPASFGPAAPVDHAAPVEPHAPAEPAATAAPYAPVEPRASVAQAAQVDPTRLVVARTLERERAVRLQAQLDRAQAAERELREQIAALQEAVQGRVDAERRIESSLRRARTELEQANAAVAAGPATDPRIDALEAQIAALTRRFDDPRTADDASPAATAPISPDDLDTASQEPIPVDAAVPVDAAEPIESADAADLAGSADPAGPVDPADFTDPADSTDAADFTDAADPADARAADTPADPGAIVDGGASPVDEVQAALAPAKARDAEPADAATTPPHPPATPSLPAVPAALLAGPEQMTGAARPTALDVLRLDAARTRLRVAATDDDDASAADSDTAPEAEDATPARPVRVASAPSGPPTPWLPAALGRLHRDDPRAAGRILTGMVRAQGLVTQRALAYDLELSDRGIVAVTVDERGTSVRQADALRPRNQVDFRVSTDEAGLARLLLGRRRPFRRRAHVRGSRRRLKELRRLAREPLGLRDLASSGVQLDPSLAFRLAALAIDPADTWAHRFTIAHAPLAGGPADAWLRIQPGGPVAVVRARPGEEPAVTLRCTRGALLAVLADIEPAVGEGAAIDGDSAVLDLLRGWIRRTEHPRNRIR